MTELNVTESTRKKTGIGRMKKANLRIDMTPMVDLGFLLIAFFIFTTEISKPAVTKLYMPHEGDTTKVPDSRSLTILLGGKNHVFYYFGIEQAALKNNQVFQATYDEMTGLGNVIRQKQTDLEKRKIDRNDLFVLIKPGNESCYKNIVAVLDEILINAVSRYSIVDPEDEEENFLKSNN
jgi:biopolymer transport protein ExbD